MNNRITNLEHHLAPNMAETAPFEQATVTTTASTLATLGVTIEDSTKYVEITFEGVVRYTEQASSGATAPTAAIGHFTAAGERRIFSAARARNLKFYGSSVVINISKLTV